MTAQTKPASRIRGALQPGVVLGRLANAGAGAAQEIPIAQLIPPQVRYADAETPSGTINGVNKVFTLKNAPVPVGSLLLFNNGTLQRPAAVDYTLAGTTVTFVTAPAGGTTLLAWYRF